MKSEASRCDKCGVFAPSEALHISRVFMPSDGKSPASDEMVKLCGRCAGLRTAATLDALSSPGSWLVKKWLKQFESASAWKSVGSNLLTVAAFAAFGAMIYDIQTTEKKTDDYRLQLETLDSTKKSIDNLKIFVEAQRSRIETEHEALNELKEQRCSLEPLVTADRQVVNALLREQERRSLETASRERWIGFALGVISSIFASAFLALGSQLLRRRALRGGEFGKQEDQTPSP